MTCYRQWSHLTTKHGVSKVEYILLMRIFGKFSKWTILCEQNDKRKSNSQFKLFLPAEGVFVATKLWKLEFFAAALDFSGYLSDNHSQLWTE